jgi:hypothetical protein
LSEQRASAGLHWADMWIKNKTAAGAILELLVAFTLLR